MSFIRLSVQVLFPVQEVAATPEDGDTAPLPLGQEQILLVDDEPALTHVVKHLLERLGYQVESHTNGLKALEAFRRHLRNQPFDLVITDMTMPQITGAALAQELLKLKPQIPIILLTGYSDKIDAAKARSLGVREFLHKPLVLRDLALLVRKILDRNPRSR